MKEKEESKQNPAFAYHPPSGTEGKGGLEDTAGRATKSRKRLKCRLAEFHLVLEDTFVSQMNTGFKCNQKIWI